MSGTLVLPTGRLAGAVRVPGSKSVTNRALLVAALASGRSVLVNPLASTDTAALAAALRRLGARIEMAGADWSVEGPLRPAKGGAIHLNVGDAGTPARFLCALLCAIEGTFVLDGSARMRERPMGPLLAALRSLGARIECAGTEGFLPVRIHGGALGGGRAVIRGDVSSQFLSALLLVSPLVPGGVALDVEGPVSSASYVALTRQTVEAFSGRPGGGYAAGRFRVPGDDSAACFPIAGALVTGGRVALHGLERASAQPDAVFRTWAEAAGGSLSWRREDGEEGGDILEVRGPAAGARGLAALSADVDGAPDAALPLCALVAFAKGTSTLTGVARLREKESDRLAAARDLLDRAGAAARVDEAGAPRLLVDGPAGRPRRADFRAHGDHRVAMAAAVLALALPPGSTLDEPGTVGKSYPRFFEDWNALLGSSSPEPA